MGLVEVFVAVLSVELVVVLVKAVTGIGRISGLVLVMVVGSVPDVGVGGVARNDARAGVLVLLMMLVLVLLIYYFW